MQNSCLHAFFLEVFYFHFHSFLHCIGEVLWPRYYTGWLGYGGTEFRYCYQCRLDSEHRSRKRNDVCGHNICTLTFSPLMTSIIQLKLAVFVMLLLAMSLGLRLCASRKGGTGGGGRVSTLGPGKWLLLGLAVESPWSSPGGPFLSSCTNGLRKRSSGHVGPPFLAGRLFSRSVGATIGQEPWLLQAR